MTARVATLSESRRRWREADTAWTAVTAARDCAAAAREVAKEQEAGATRWVEIANSPEPHIGTDEFCMDMGKLCHQTAANARRHAAAYDKWADTVRDSYDPDAPGVKVRSEVEWKLED